MTTMQRNELRAMFRVMKGKALSNHAKHNLFYYPYAFFKNAQAPLLKVAALYFDKLVISRSGPRELGNRRRGLSGSNCMNSVQSGTIEHESAIAKNVKPVANGAL